jgi:signal peptide peptidase SppA
MNIPWALTAEAYETLVAIASREKVSAEELEQKLDSLAAKVGKPLQNTRESYVRDGVAVVPVVGPIFRYASFFTRISGATSTQELALDFTAALEDPSVRGIVLEMNSPGGEVTGVNEFSKLVAGARGVKPVTAYVGGQAQSGGYWIAAAAERIVVDDTALLGSIGVVMTARDSSDSNRQAGVHEIVSSQSPHKRSNPGTEAGRGKLQAMVDSLADVFIASVAQNRGVDSTKVASDFGQGGSLVGAAAVAAGMADAVGSLEGLLAEMGVQAGSTGFKFSGRAAAIERTNMVGKDGKPAAAVTEDSKCPTCGGVMECSACSKSKAEAVALAITGERSRIAAIIGHAEAPGREQLSRTLAFDSDMTAEAAGKILAAAPKASASGRTPLTEAMERHAPNPALGAGGLPADAEDPKALGRAIAALANGSK